MPLPSRADVVVIGAGLAGLTATLHLQRAGVDAVLLEVEERPGGRVRTDLVDGVLLDRGFQLINPSYPEVRRVLDLDALDLRRFDAGVRLCLERGRYTVGDPARLPSSLVDDLRAPFGTWRQKAAFLRWALPVVLGPASAVRASADRSLADELVGRGLDGEITERLIRPFLSGVLADRELATSQRVASMLLRSFGRGRPAVPGRGMQAVPDQLAARLAAGSAHYGVRVGSVSGAQVDTDVGRLRAPVVVVATDGVQAAGLGVPGAPMRSLTTWWFLADEPPHDRALLHVDGAGRGPLANSVVMTNAAPGYAPAGRALVQATMVGVPGASSDGAAAGCRELLAEVRRHAGLLYGADAAGWELVRTDVIAGALPVHPPGQPLQRRVDLGDGLLVAGDHRDTPSIQGAMVSGRRAAVAALARLRT